MTSADVLLHPVRLRIVQTFLGEQALTTADLRARLPDVSAATLYRQVATLVARDVLEVVAERPVRGTVERTYRLRLRHASIDPAAAAAMTPDDHRAAFLAFVAGLLADFDRYLDRGDVDLVHDMVGYRQAGFYATDADLVQLTATIGAALMPLMTAGEGAGRTRRMLTTILLPATPSTPAGLATSPPPAAEPPPATEPSPPRGAG